MEPAKSGLSTEARYRGTLRSALLRHERIKGRDHITIAGQQWEFGDQLIDLGSASILSKERQ